MSATSSNPNLQAELILSEQKLKQNRDEKQQLQTELVRVKARNKKGDAQKELDNLMAKITINDKNEKKIENEVQLLKHRINKQLGKSFNVVLQKIQLKNQDLCSGILNTAFVLIIEKMKQADSFFKLMYSCPVYTGSYYEKLRIKDACEFDINLVLAHRAVKINPPPNASQHTTLRMEDMKLGDKDARSLNYLLDEQRCILPNKVLGWIQSVMDLAQLTSITMNGVKKITPTASGPAKTLLIVLNDTTQTTISVDLVPVFRFPFLEWPANVNGLRKPIVNETVMSKRNLYLVPKGYRRGNKQSPTEPPQKDKPRVWRMHFAEIETGVLERNQRARPVIQLLKLLRDCQKWHSLHSYFLKTLVLNEIAANPTKQWTQELIPERLFEMLEKLKLCLDRKTLQHFFFQTVNLLQYMNAAEMANISQRLDKIIKIRDNPNLVEAYFYV